MNTSMPEHGQSLAFLVTVVIFALVMGLVWKRKITERFALLWIAISIMLLLASSLGSGICSRSRSCLGFLIRRRRFFCWRYLG